jgi:hypothetical protein
MPHALSNLDAVWTLAALVPLAVAAAAWALQIACGFCSADPPEFWHAVTIIVVTAITNVVLRFLLQATDSAHGIWAEYVAPAVATAVVIAVGLPAAPFMALTIMVVQVFLCAMMYYCLGWLQTAVTAPMFA